LRPELSGRRYLQCPSPIPGEILMQDDIVALFAYDRWANRRVLDACRTLTAEQYGAEPVPGWSSVRSTNLPRTGARNREVVRRGSVSALWRGSDASLQPISTDLAATGASQANLCRL
jgi:hypothetical protein